MISCRNGRRLAAATMSVVGQVVRSRMGVMSFSRLEVFAATVSAGS